MKQHCFFSWHNYVHVSKLETTEEHKIGKLKSLLFLLPWGLLLFKCLVWFSQLVPLCSVFCWNLCYQHLSHSLPFKNKMSSSIHVACLMARSGFLNPVYLVCSSSVWPLSVRVPHHCVVRLLISLQMLRNLSWVITICLLKTPKLMYLVSSRSWTPIPCILLDFLN